MRGMTLSATLTFAFLGAAGAALALDALPAGVTANKLGHGWTFAGAGGMTLYTYDPDEGSPGTSECIDECAVTWPPFLAAEDSTPVGGFGFVVRPSGEKQWAYKGKPLYYYSNDEFPGGAFGDGMATVWHVAFQQIDTPAEAAVGWTTLGQVLTNAAGRTVYAMDDTAMACDAQCQRTWRPITAPWLATDFSDWSVIMRSDQLKQWAFQGRGLYTYAGDINPGEINGDSVAGWSVVVLQPEPPLPPWATVQASDAGELLANAEGLTVYSQFFNPRNRRLSPEMIACNGECVDKVWVPFLAGEDAKPTGLWTIVTRKDGRKQWAYKGQRIFTNIDDKKPGDFKGIRFGGDRSFSAIMRNGLPMQGVTVGG